MPQLDYHLLNNDDQERGCVVSFYDRPVEHKFRSKEEGRPIFVDTIYVRIMTVGQQKSTVDTPAKEQHFKKYPRAWAVYQNKEKVDHGTPIGEWPVITRSRSMELEHVNVLSVEHLAEVTDANLPNIGPDGMGLRDKARQYLAGQTEKDVELTALKEAVDDLSKNVKELSSVNDKKDGDIEKRDKQIGDLLDKVDESANTVKKLEVVVKTLQDQLCEDKPMAAQAKPRGRPKKVKADDAADDSTGHAARAA